MADIAKLKEALSKSLNEFQEEVNSHFETDTGKYCTKAELEEIAKQTYYMVSGFRDAIIKYLEEHSK